MALERAITTTVWGDRKLGHSKQVEVPQRATWIATGNNLTPYGDMIRRCYFIRMDAKTSQPWKGRTFVHADVEGWVRAHRGELIAALFTLARSWINAGRPAPDVELIGGFEEWTRVVGGILQHAGIEGFFGNLSELYETVDDETHEWAALLEAIHAYLQAEGKATFTTKELARTLEDEYGSEKIVQERHVQAIIEALPDKILGAGSP